MVPCSFARRAQCEDDDGNQHDQDEEFDEHISVGGWHSRILASRCGLLSR